MPNQAQLTLRKIMLPSTYERQASSDDYAFTALSLMASVATVDGYIVLPRYITYHRVARTILGATQLETAQVRASALQHFLATEQLLKQLEKLIAAIRRQQVARQTQIAIVDQLLTLLESTPQINDAGVRAARSLIDDLGLPLTDFAARLDAIEQAMLRDATALAPSSNAPLQKRLLGEATARLGDLRSSLSQITRGTSPVMTPLRTVGNDKNEIAQRVAQRALMIGTVIGSTDVVQAATEFLQQLKPQPCQIALVGEMKHGKSSIFNLIIGNTLSPVGEATATTAAVVELHYAEHPTYEGRWLGEEALVRLQQFIREHSDNPRVANYGRLLNYAISSDEFLAGGTIDGLDSMTKMTDYVTVTGQFACAVEKVRIGLPLDSLRHGACLIDTPGINDPMRVRDYITIEAAKQADCVVFVMRADKLGTESERLFLCSLLESGKAIRLIVVLTHTDRISSASELARVFEAARTWLNQIGRDVQASEVIAAAKLYGFDARDLGEQQKSPTWNDTGFGAFWSELERTASDTQRNNAYLQWVATRQQAITEQVERELRHYRQRYIEGLPDTEEVAALNGMIARFTQMAQTYSSQIGSRLATIEDRLRLDHRHLTEDLDRLKDDTLTELRAEIERSVRQFGEEYHKESKWKQFDTEFCDRIIRTRLKEFTDRNQDRLELWNRDIQRFADEMEQGVQMHLAELQMARNEFAGICETNHRLLSAMCRLDRAVASAEKLVLGGAVVYTAVGGVALFGFGNAVLFSTLAGLFTGGVAPIIIAGVTLTTWGVHKILSDPEARKAKFIEQKVEKTRLALDQRFEAIEVAITRELNSVWDSFVFVAESRYQPLVLESLASAEEARLRYEIARRMREDTTKYLDSLVISATERTIDAG